jgi:Kinetochore complex Fta4 of Sim4 subunit, or CENP-50
MDVYANKKSFIEAQVRRLTTTLAPSREYKSAVGAQAEDTERLSDTLVENAIYKCIARCNAI